MVFRRLLYGERLQFYQCMSHSVPSNFGRPKEATAVTKYSLLYTNLKYWINQSVGDLCLGGLGTCRAVDNRPIFHHLLSRFCDSPKS